MNKEEIIIDGVNVKDCKRRFGKNSYCRYFKRSCADNNFNCIWKQHERLKEENVNLKQQLEIDKNQINYFIEENEKLKTQYNCYACGNCKGKEDYINFEKHHKGLRKQFDKQNKQLRDIQEIVQDFCNACKEFEPEKTEDKKTCLYCNYGNILDIINDKKESEER